MKKFLAGIALIAAFSLGTLASSLIHANECLVQNVTIDQPLSLSEAKNCSILNVKFIREGRLL